MEISSLEPPIFILALAMQDTKIGVAGGIEIGIGGTYYTRDGNVFHGSGSEIGMVQT